MIKLTERLIIPDVEFEFTFARSSGAGGQNVNKVSSKAYLRWSITKTQSLPQEVIERFISTFPTKVTESGEVVIYSDEYRDQPRNVEACKEKLRDLILQVLNPPKKRRPTNPTYSSKLKRLEGKSFQKKKKEVRKKISW